MSYSWLEGHLAVGAWGMLFNTFVHVIMYRYYSQVAAGRTVWYKVRLSISPPSSLLFPPPPTTPSTPSRASSPSTCKKYITMLQIVQFATSFLATAYLMYLRAAGSCLHNSGFAAEFTVACNVSFFYLFIDFYRKNNREKKRSAADAETSKDK